ncbi:M48 family metallopeptidase [Candidatus Pacearchaeota archaeon]|nr:M48 family metallopeptidase [Candidatus Pacearchaeota archaeon]
MERISFYDQIARNKRNSIFLMLAVGIMIIIIGYAISFIFPTEYVFFILIISITLGIIWPWIGYYNSGKMAIWSVGAKKADSIKHRMYYNIVEGLTIASGTPMPQLYIMPGQQINAFASGRDPKNAVICVTEGCLAKLNKQELEGVLAHEMSHIANYDIRFMTLTTILVGIISIMAEIFLRSLWLSDRDNNGGKSGTILILIGVVLAIIAPIVTTLVQLAISRKREYAADATAVKMTRSPTGLMSALLKIKSDTAQLKVSGSVAPLFFVKPNNTMELFQTHPALDKRIEVLRKM